jgi:hypothetical protein
MTAKMRVTEVVAVDAGVRSPAGVTVTMRMPG